MMTQEEFMDVKEMRDAGMTYAEIAEKVGYHRTTIAKWIKARGPPGRRAPAAARVVVTDPWQTRRAAMMSCGRGTVASWDARRCQTARSCLVDGG